MLNKGPEVNNNHHFSNDFILAKFLEVSRRFPGPMIHDQYGFDKSYAHLLGDAVRTRDELIKALPPSHMLPALLGVLKDTEEIPRTISQKPIEKLILRDFFGVTDYWSIENPTPGVESCGNLPPQSEATTRPGDWCGLQRAD